MSVSLSTLRCVLGGGLAASVVVSCGTPIVAGMYTMVGSRTVSPGCTGSPPSGALGVASTEVSARDASGVYTMTLRIGSGNQCVLTLASRGSTAEITDAHSCDATIAPPFFPVGHGTLENSSTGLRLTVRWSMAGAGSNTACWTDDVWSEATR